MTHSVCVALHQCVPAFSQWYMLYQNWFIDVGLIVNDLLAMLEEEDFIEAEVTMLPPGDGQNS